MSHWILHPDDLTPEPGVTLTTPEQFPGEKPPRPFKISSSLIDMVIISSAWQDGIVNVTPGEVTPQPSNSGPGIALTDDITINWNLTAERTRVLLQLFTKQVTLAAFKEAQVQVPEALRGKLHSHRLEHHPQAREWHARQRLIHPDPKKRFLLTLVRHTLNGNAKQAANFVHRFTLKPHAPGTPEWNARHEFNNRILESLAYRFSELTPAKTISEQAPSYSRGVLNEPKPSNP